MPGGETPAFNFLGTNVRIAAIINSPLTPRGLGDPGWEMERAAARIQPLPAHPDPGPCSPETVCLRPQRAATGPESHAGGLSPSRISHLFPLSSIDRGEQGKPRALLPGLESWLGHSLAG